jgi:hypothetical protein
MKPRYPIEMICLREISTSAFGKGTEMYIRFKGDMGMDQSGDRERIGRALNNMDRSGAPTASGSRDCPHWDLDDLNMWFPDRRLALTALERVLALYESKP